jgi:hypothetical protein
VSGTTPRRLQSEMAAEYSEGGLDVPAARVMGHDRGRRPLSLTYISASSKRDTHDDGMLTAARPTGSEAGVPPSST